MAENQQSNDNSNLNQSPNDVSPPSTENFNASGSVPAKKEVEKEKTKPECCKHPDIIINTPREDNSIADRIAARGNRIASNANWLTFLNIILSIALFVITLRTLYVTRESVQVSRDALTQAITQNREDNVRNARNDADNRLSDSINSVLSDKTLKSYVDNMIENQKPFLIENRPLIQIANTSIDTSKEYSHSVIRYEVVNLGKYPARIILTNSQLILLRN